MRILFLNYEYPPLGGGAGNATKYILYEFSKQKNTIVDVVTSSVDNFKIEKIGDNITIYKLPIGKNVDQAHSQSRSEIIKYTFRAFIFSRKLMHQNRYDLAHSFFTVPCGFLSYLFKLFYGLPFVVSLRGADVPGYTERFKILYIFIKPLVKLIWGNSSAVVSNSDKLRNIAYMTNKKQKIDIIFNGIDTDEFYPSVQKKRGDKFKILFVSRLCQRKGAIYLLEAVEKLVKLGLKVDATFVGDGDMREELYQFPAKHGISDSVFFYGSISHNELPKIYQSADVFVFPSLNEGMSNALLEALASGLPVIVTDVGGTQELIKNGINGYVVPLRDSNSIAEAIKSMIDNPNITMCMSNENRKKAESMSWKNVAENYLNIYGNIVKAKKEMI